MVKINNILNNRFLYKSCKQRYCSLDYLIYNNLHFYNLDKIKYNIIDILLWLISENYHVKKYVIYYFNELGKSINTIKHHVIINEKYK